MASPLKRPAVLLDLAAFLGISVFSISTDAPIIQQDLLKRCQETLLVRHISTNGLTVDGRDVVLTGAPGSLIVSSLARSVVAGVNGVRAVRVKLLTAGEAVGEPDDISSALVPSVGAVKPSAPPEVQQKIDRVLENQEIAFSADSTVLTPEDQVTLDRIAAFLAAAPALLCEVRGYDSEPLEMRQNWVLALQRALATEDYLETKGIAEWRLSARVLRIGEDTQGRRTDRPVDLVVGARK